MHSAKDHTGHGWGVIGVAAAQPQGFAHLDRERHPSPIGELDERHLLFHHFSIAGIQ